MEKYLRWIQKIGIGIALILVIGQVYSGYLALSEHSLEFVKPTNILISTAILFLTLGFQVFGWNLLMKESAVKLPFWEAARGYLITFLPRYIPGSVWGYLSRSQWLLDKYQISYQSSNSVSVIEILIAVAASVITILGFLLGRIDTSLLWLVPLIFIGTYSLWRIAYKLLNLTIIKKILGYWQYSDYTFNIQFRTWLKSLGIIIINMYLNGISFYFLLSVFGFSGNGLTIPFLVKITGLYNMGWLVGFLVFFIPSGLGLRELTFSTLLITELMIDGNTASALAVIFRLVNIVAEMIWVLGSVLLFRIYTHIKEKNQLIR